MDLFQLLWLHGVGRWLLHHAHDLLAIEGTDGPHVLLMSATSWAPGSSFYHIPITPTVVLRPAPQDVKALEKSTLTIMPTKMGAGAVFVSGKYGQERQDAIRQLVSGLCLPQPGRNRSFVEQLRDELPPGRQQVLFVVLSGLEAQIVGDYIKNRLPQLERGSRSTRCFRAWSP